VLAAVVGYAAVLYGVVLAVQQVVGDDPVDWLQPLGPVVGSLVGTPLGLWLVARRLGGMERVTQLQAALRSRRLPDDADPSVWRPLLLGQRRLQQRIVVVTQVLLVAVGLAALVVTDVSTGVLPLGLAVLLLVAVLVGWASRRSQRPLDELIAGLPAEPVSRT
jgi:uncharacterized membrane protein YfcA